MTPPRQARHGRGAALLPARRGLGSSTATAAATVTTMAADDGAVDPSRRTLLRAGLVGAYCIPIFTVVQKYNKPGPREEPAAVAIDGALRRAHRAHAGPSPPSPHLSFRPPSTQAHTRTHSTRRGTERSARLAVAAAVAAASCRSSCRTSPRARSSRWSPPPHRMASPLILPPREGRTGCPLSLWPVLTGEGSSSFPTATHGRGDDDRRRGRWERAARARVGGGGLLMRRSQCGRKRKARSLFHGL